MIHSIESKFLNQSRDYWVSLPLRYDSSTTYPVLYVLDAEWRFDLVRHIAYDMGGNKKMPHHIVVGIPHIDWEKQRGIDLTFSHSRIEYDGEHVDTTFYNATNSGGGTAFYQYLTEELIPTVDKNYATNKERVLIGHSYGGYFGAYLLPRDTFFYAYQIYDPSIWYSEGEVTNGLSKIIADRTGKKVFVSFQPEPIYHSQHILKFIERLYSISAIKVGVKEYPDETHNSLYLQSFLDGMSFLFTANKRG